MNKTAHKSKETRRHFQMRARGMAKNLLRAANSPKEWAVFSGRVFVNIASNMMIRVCGSTLNPFTVEDQLFRGSGINRKKLTTAEKIDADKKYREVQARYLKSKPIGFRKCS